MIYEFNTWSRNLNADSTLKYCLFGAVKLNKNAILDKYSYSGYGIGTDSSFLCQIFILVNTLLFFT